MNEGSYNGSGNVFVVNRVAIGDEESAVVENEKGLSAAKGRRSDAPAIVEGEKKVVCCERSKE